MSSSTDPFTFREALGAAKMLLLTLKARGITVTDEARECITACTDEQLFADWAIRVQSITTIGELVGQAEVSHVEAHLQSASTALRTWRKLMNASTRSFAILMETQGSARMLLLTLKARGIAVSDEARERITGCTDEQQFEDWILRAQTITTADELFT